jgi:hypothetical protein
VVARLPRDVYVLQAGLLVNVLGNGAAAPFLVIYLHDVRGAPLGVAGLAASTGAACALTAAQLGFIAGPALGGFVRASAPFALWSGAALLALLGAAYSLRFDRLLPEQHRRTPATDRLRAGAVEGEAS